MNSTTFPQNTYPQNTKPTKKLSVSTGFTQLLRLGNGNRFMAYIKDHEAWALILLAIFLIAGTVFYVDFQPRPGGASVESSTTTHF